MESGHKLSKLFMARTAAKPRGCIMAFVVWVALGAIASADAPSPPVEETACSALVETLQGKVDVVNDDSLKVLEHTSANGSFAYKRENTRAIRCLRTDLVPAVNDFKVLRAGYPLYVVRAGPGESRMGVLEVSGGQFRFRMVQGELTSEEKQRLQLRLDQIQETARTIR